MTAHWRVPQLYRSPWDEPNYSLKRGLFSVQWLRGAPTRQILGIQWRGRDGRFYSLTVRYIRQAPSEAQLMAQRSVTPSNSSGILNGR